MTTAIASWGNSNAVRIPQSIMKQAGLRKGDRVRLAVNEQGRIELFPESRKHRSVRPKAGVTFESLMKAYGEFSSVETEGWPVDDFVGAEREAWFE